MPLPPLRLSFWLCVERLRREFEDAFNADQHERASYIAQDIRILEETQPPNRDEVEA